MKAQMTAQKGLRIHLMVLPRINIRTQTTLEGEETLEDLFKEDHLHRPPQMRRNPQQNLIPPPIHQSQRESRNQIFKTSKIDKHSTNRKCITIPTGKGRKERIALRVRQRK